ncbi:hypothetical protein [Cognatishimia activa]|uniref:Uncharacterized protein n=1 Tax=Cognatishimia activa TaxID=1715691 RepID=A0A0P1IKV4_9RHOB|nr:hypothetical protein [Cognatishimia activa]CUI27628.1 hypothetical protein TA5113_00054 [Cognatishimia activa]CUK24247.1 hypothetical protein TA5114_00022 [Cognatishimia activa]
MSNADLKKQGTTVFGAFVRSQILILELIAFGFVLYLLQQMNVSAQILIATALLGVFTFTLITGRGFPHFRHRGKALLFLMVACFFLAQGAVVFDEQREARWTLLRQTDPDAFLAELASVDENRWMEELRELRPSEFEDEIARREAEAEAQQQEAARRAKAEAAELRAAEALAVKKAERLIASSDDLDQHRTAFTRAAITLVDNRTCTDAEFIENGGWVRSTSFGSRPIYFMYCGGSTVANRQYLDAATGAIFRGTEVTQTVDPNTHISDAEANRLAECTDQKISRAYVMIQSDVRRSLRSPSTAEFPGRYGIGTRHLGNCIYQVVGHFDAQNGFGAIIRGTFTGTTEYFPESGSWQTLTLDVRG